MMTRSKFYLWLTILVITAMHNAGCQSVQTAGEKPSIETALTLIPPSPVTSQIQLSIRGAVHNTTQREENYTVKVYWDRVEAKSLISAEQLTLQPGERRLVASKTKTSNHIGKHKIVMVVEGGSQRSELSRPIEVLDSKKRTTARIGGAWLGFYHWSESEGAPWNAELKKMTDEQWKELVRAMHEVGMNIIVLQELFRNEAVVDQHEMTVENYPGKAFYPSDLYPGRVPIAAKDAVEAVLSEADRLGMHVFVGVGSFAWFDFGPESLRWHKAVADEIWQRYGHHQSFYGWYISEEIEGGLSAGAREEPLMSKRHQEIVNFFSEFRKHVDKHAPEKPVMLATNAHHIDAGEHVYPALLENLDILCPFAFHRMPQGDTTGEIAAARLQKLCDQAGSHLWMDMEVFDFGPNGLIPRPIEGLVDDLNRFPIFEKILVYQFPGLMNARWMSRHPGGPATVKLYEDYKDRLESGRLVAVPIEHLANGLPYRLAHEPSQTYPGEGESPLTDGWLGNANYKSPAWVGFEGEPLDIVIQLKDDQLFDTVEVGFLQNHAAGIFLPEQVRVGFSSDGKEYRWLQANRLDDDKAAGRHRYAIRNDHSDAKFVRILTRSPVKLPNDHPAAGSKRWTFVDEVLMTE